MRSIPLVDHAEYSILNKTTVGNLPLPGSVTVVYTCEKGYELADEVLNMVKCVYDSHPRIGRPECDTESILVSAKWTDDEVIKCNKGQ